MEGETVWLQPPLVLHSFLAPCFFNAIAALPGGELFHIVFHIAGIAII